MHALSYRFCVEVTQTIIVFRMATTLTFKSPQHPQATQGVVHAFCSLLPRSQIHFCGTCNFGSTDALGGLPHEHQYSGLHRRIACVSYAGPESHQEKLSQERATQCRVRCECSDSSGKAVALNCQGAVYPETAIRV